MALIFHAQHEAITQIQIRTDARIRNLIFAVLGLHNRGVRLRLDYAGADREIR